MRRSRFLNTVLVTNAVLMTLVLGAVLAGRFTLVATAQAEPPRQPSGIPDPGEQRNEQIKQLRELNEQIKAMRTELKDMEFRVNVLSMPAGSDAKTDNKSK